MCPARHSRQGRLLTSGLGSPREPGGCRWWGSGACCSRVPCQSLRYHAGHPRQGRLLTGGRVVEGECLLGADGGGVVHAAVAAAWLPCQAAPGGAGAWAGHPHGRPSEGHPAHPTLLPGPLPAHGGGETLTHQQLQRLLHTPFPPLSLGPFAKSCALFPVLPGETHRNGPWQSCSGRKATVAFHMSRIVLKELVHKSRSRSRCALPPGEPGVKEDPGEGAGRC